MSSKAIHPVFLGAMLGAMTGGFGCGAGVPVPNDQWAAAQADVGRAQSAGALDVPEAKLHLQLAQEDLQAAKKLMNTDNDRAASLCAVASNEAQLAVSLARQASAQEQVKKAQAETQKASDK
jgi:hypothetical protein